MKSFIKKFFIYSIPLFIAIALYICLDPFKVIWHYDNFYPPVKYQVVLDMDYVSTTNYDNKRKEQKYDSFILGNSRSRCWRIKDWKEHIGNDANCYHFDAHGETLLGIEKKLEYISKHSLSIKNALIIIDESVLKETEAVKTHLRYICPQLVNYSNVFGFHFCFLKSFYTPEFTKAYLDYKISGQVKQYMLDQELFYETDYYDPIHNEYLPLKSEKKIQKGTFYDEKRMELFEDWQHPDSVSPVIIQEKQQEMLTHIANILQEHKTDYRIVINPLFNQISINPNDLYKLKAIFGKDCVYNFSGVNNITSDYHNYYENSHYRMYIAKQLLKTLYKND